VVTVITEKAEFYPQIEQDAFDKDFPGAGMAKLRVE
jgi:hypothetical protein